MAKGQSLNLRRRWSGADRAGIRTERAGLFQGLQEPATIEQAIDTAALMLESDKSRGYCLEMICADFLPGAHLQDGNPKIVLLSMMRLFRLSTAALRQDEMAGAAKLAALCADSRSTTSSAGAGQAMIRKAI
jgi:hypothetical protein